MTVPDVAALAQWANTPHIHLGFSERQLQVQALFAELERLRADGSWAAKEIERTNAKAAKLRQELDEARCEIERLIAGWQPW